MPKVIILGSSNAIPTKDSENTHMVIVGDERTLLIDSVSNPILRLEQAGVDFNDLHDIIILAGRNGDVSFLGKLNRVIHQVTQYLEDPVMVKELIDSTEKSYIIIDIRSASEYRQSHIKGAINIPSYTNPDNVYQSLTNKNQEFNKQSNKLTNKKMINLNGYNTEAD